MLNGQHIRVIWTRWSGNPKGLVGPLKGAVILEFLTRRLNFTYEMVRVTEDKPEPSEKERGLFSYLWNQVEFILVSIQKIKSDLLVHDTIATFQYNSIIDFTLPWIYDDFAFLIPVPDESANINAVVKPFQWPVWLGLGISIVCVIAVLNLIHHYLEYRLVVEKSLRPNNNSPTEKIVNKGETGKQYVYVFGTLLSQGGPCRSKRLPYRLVAGVWTLAAFIFVQAYTSTLFTYVVTPISEPLIDSVYDVVNNGDINLLVRETGFMNTLLSASLFGKLRTKMDSFPNSNCGSMSACAEAVKSEYRNVFLDANVYLKDVIKTDFKKTGKCNYQLTKEEFRTIMSSLALQKNSRYTQSIQQGVLNLQEIGLVNYWDTWFRPMPPQCTGKPQSGNKTQKLSPLTLKNVTGAFLVLSVGFSLSLLAFLGEKIVSRREQFRNRKDNKLRQVPNNLIEVSSKKTEEPIPSSLK
ncbi:hypothetical protein DAPPUDRAFT_316803 [Daphnia pulex]|uniref:Ionotropic glutamate receptor C-terminal domain-containing protein n=1 Tax=Daphnia pulex TaxID=6669 RepID=E9GE20_DAPPU|nr:hypothetical protein DAPPUDRAFT_316803 [Daphnia pulex]|eukprot:EFX82390.1 hypothetical protein DAPPUDRAFT_316803 [Daphnia pulex]